MKMGLPRSTAKNFLGAKTANNGYLRLKFDS